MDLGELKFAMWAAWAAGFDKKVPTNWLPNSLLAKRLVRGTLEGYIFQNPTHVIIAFQGTNWDEPQDVWTDLKFRKVRMPGVPGRWHRGFLMGAGKFYIEIANWLKENLGSRKLIITGFSLGAALAQCLSVILTFQSQKHRVYTFGGPRVANVKAGLWLASRTEHYRIHVYDDPVVHVPPFFFGYKHFGKRRVFDQHGKLRRGPVAWLSTIFQSQRTRHGHDRSRYLLLVRELSDS